MKRVFFSILAFSLVTSISIAEFCYGKALIPRIKICDMPGGSKWSSQITLSNISEHDVNVFIKLYDQDGSLLTDDYVRFSSYNIDTICTTDTFCSASFTISSNSSALLVVRPSLDTNIASNLIFGYGLVEWERDEGFVPVSIIGDGLLWCEIEQTNGISSCVGEHFTLSPVENLF